ncbi:hypothetical protein [Schinkia azotoformans]|uniref:hypothetical protein n=1 Tax=Schinkia azotoformans TaxID=1454 RepID=UPI002DBDE2F7|nr:hypothetical protein [Schinkia azotoformans]MEC1759843.1 hypothetical protein [Schinkia azotoformans]
MSYLKDKEVLVHEVITAIHQKKSLEFYKLLYRKWEFTFDHCWEPDEWAHYVFMPIQRNAVLYDKVNYHIDFVTLNGEMEAVKLRHPRRRSKYLYKKSWTDEEKTHAFYEDILMVEER